MHGGDSGVSGSLHVAVIGAGSLGMSSAFNLAQRGVKVTVLDQDHIASGSTGRSVGVVGTQHVDPFEILIRVHSIRQMKGWRSRGLGFRAIGYLRLGRSERDIALFEKSIAMQREHGITSPRVLDTADIRKLVPHMNTDGLAGGLFGPDDGFIDPHLMCNLLAGMVREAGGVVKQRCGLLAAERAGSGYRLITSGGNIACDGVVIATGAWAAQTAALFGKTLNVVPERHEAITIRLSQPLDYVMPMVMDLVQGGGGTGLNFRHDKPDELITEIHKVAPGKGEDPDAYNEQINEETKSALAELLLERVPDLPGAGFGRGWAGLYPKTPDGRPFVGPFSADEPMLVAAAGGGGYGIQLGPVIGRLAADWLTEGRPATIPEAHILQPTPDRNPPART